MSLDALLRPRSVAVVGASQNPQKVGGMPVRLLLDLGFDGAIYPINPSTPTLQGLPSFASFAALPHAVDLAIFALPASAVEAALQQAVDAGTRAAIILSSGFAEVGDEGAAVQQRLAAIARRGNLTLLGPNCLGAMNLRSRLFATFSPAPLAGLPTVGGVAIVSQSGAFGGYAFSLARAGGLGLSHWVTTGNEATTSVADVIEYLIDDDDTRVIVAYIEGARDGRALHRALRRARRAGKPVVVTKVGRTEAGARAAQSHTASLSGEDAVYQAVFDDTATVRAQSIEQMFRLGQAFSIGVAPRGRRLGIITISGGVGTLMADAASDAGLELPPLPDGIAGELRRRIAFCSTANPIDVTGQVTADYDVMDFAAVEAARCGAYDAVVLFLAAAGAAPSYAAKFARTVRLMREAAPEVSVAFSGIVGAGLKAELEAMGCLVYEEPTHAIDAFAAMADWRLGTSFESTQDTVMPPVEAAAGMMNEVEGLAFLAAHGIGAAPHRHVTNAADAVLAWRSIGGEGVLKIVSRDLLHKSDVGGVQVGLRTEQEVRDAYAAIDNAVAANAPRARHEGMLIARRLRPRVEVMLGARHDDNFGPLVVLGLGGVGVELDPRTTVLTAPTTPGHVRASLVKLGIVKRLAAYRGAPAIDPGTLIDAVMRFADLAAGLGAALQTMEVNPLMVTAEGVAAADAVVEIRAIESAAARATEEQA